MTVPIAAVDETVAVKVMELPAAAVVAEDESVVVVVVRLSLMRIVVALDELAL